MSFQSTFIWTDLSTYQLEEAKNFYQSTFHWHYQIDEQVAEGPYLMAYLGNQYVAGMYELPLAFQGKHFPSFWMPYIHVKDVKATVTLAESFHNVRIELPPTSFSDGSTIALVRDPLGAGFTVYEGPIQKKTLKPGHGVLQWFELHVSRLQTVIPFYERLFGWRIEFQNNEQQALISSVEGDPIANFYELSEAFRGGYEYWIPTFQVGAIDPYCQQVQHSNGKVFQIFGDGRQLVNDSQGAAFIVSTKANS